jgi:hypothetical protein
VDSSIRTELFPRNTDYGVIAEALNYNGGEVKTSKEIHRMRKKTFLGAALNDI